MSRRAATGRGTDRGSGVLSTTFGVGVFLALLAFAAHVLVGLWVDSTVEAVAADAATEVALDPTGGRAARAAALARARRALGDHADRVRLEFEDDPAGRTVILRVRGEGVGLVPGLEAVGRIDRRIVVRREVP